jgi:hypothetical protein
MIKVLLAILFGGCLMTSTALAQGKYYTTYFVRDRVAPSDVEYLCKVSLDQAALESHLRDIGGPWRDVKPSIDWNEFMTITVAPNESYAAFDLALRTIEEDGYKFALRWGWWNSSQRRWKPLGTQNTLSSKTVGNAKARQILIVVVKRYLFTPTNRLYCQKYGG